MPDTPEISASPKFVLVTGASSGIGLAIVQDLARRGWQVFGSVRSPADAERISGIQPEKIFPIRMDLTKPAEIEQSMAQVAERTGPHGLQGLINNAGLAVNGPIEFLNLEDIRLQIEVNFLGQIAVTQAALPLIRLGPGRIVNISSISGRIAMPFFAPYAASKFALEAFSDSLRLELRPWGLHVALIEPGAVETPIWEKSLQAADRRIENLPPLAHAYYGVDINRMRAKTTRTGQNGVSPQQVADAVFHALAASRPKTRYYIGRGIEMTAFFAKHAPDWLRDWVVARMTGFDRQA
jgi:NAD(P)-dependent dehydrogenase (short-subunit alcohol dehydrogenase family)